MGGGGYLADPAIFLVRTAFTLYILAVMLRILLQWAQADFYNPITQFLVRVTDPLLRPLSALLPTWQGVNLAGLAVMYALQVLAIYLVLIIQGFSPPAGPLLTTALGELIALLLNLLTVVIIIQVIISWVNPTASHPGITLLYQLTEPLLRPIRRLLPALGGLDLSPLIALILIHMVRLLAAHPLQGQFGPLLM